jgi:hypothetical protein
MVAGRGRLLLKLMPWNKRSELCDRLRRSPITPADLLFFHILYTCGSPTLAQLFLYSLLNVASVVESVVSFYLPLV